MFVELGGKLVKETEDVREGRVGCSWLWGRVKGCVVPVHTCIPQTRLAGYVANTPGFSRMPLGPMEL